MTSREFGYEPSGCFEVDTVHRDKHETVATRLSLFLFSLGVWALLSWAGFSLLAYT